MISPINQRTFASFYRRGGFGLIELLVSISIMVLVTTIVLANHSAFNGGSLLRSQAYEIALRLREVQLSAVGTQTDGSADFRSLYGLEFDMGDTTHYTTFAVDAGDADLSGRTTIGIPGGLDRRFEITCVERDGSGCVDTIVVFNRPNFDARFFDGNGNEQAGVSEVVISVGQRGTAGTGRDPASERRVIVTRAGQISVE